MSIPADLHTEFSEQMFQQNLWWSYEKVDEDELIHVSTALSNELGRPVETLDDLMGSFATSLLKMKLEEAIKCSQASYADSALSRFLAAFETVHGKRTFQNQINFVKLNGRHVVLVTCIDVTEVVEDKEACLDVESLAVIEVYERQEFLERQNKLIKDAFAKQSRFLALLSHELRSPLLGISSIVKRLRDKVNGGDDVDNMLKTISMTADQSTHLVNDILTYTQTEYEGLKLHASSVDLIDVIENVETLTRSIAHDKGLSLSVHTHIDHPDVKIDSVRLTQVLINLIVNAIKFTQHGGVTLTVNECENGHFVFSVNDTGEGINSAHLEEIFKPFAQLENDCAGSREGQYLGAGLGLFVVKQLVELMGGKVEVTSEPSEGTCFEFGLDLLPKAEQASQGVKAEPAKINHESGNIVQSDKVTKRILVADDSEINRMVLRGFLADLDCDVVEAKDGREAWFILQKHSFDYVILDIQMPNMDGVEVAYRLSALCKRGKQPQLKGVFAVTAGIDSTGFEKQGNLIEAGIFDEWVIKPVSKTQIVKLLKNDYRSNARNESISATASSNEVQITLSDLSLNNETVDSVNVFDEVPDHFKDLMFPLMDEMKQNLTQLEALILENKSEEIAELAHYMKGNAMVFQLNELVDLCRALEVLQGDVVEKDRDLTLKMQKNGEILQNIHLTVKSLEKSLSISHNSPN